MSVRTGNKFFENFEGFPLSGKGALRISAAALMSGAVLSLGACATDSSNVWSSVPNLTSASPVVFQQATGKLALAPVIVTLPERRSIGTLSRNVGCWVFVRQLTDADFPAADALNAPLVQALSAARLAVTTDASGDVSGAGTNDYLLSATVAGAHADMCDNTFMETGPNAVNLEIDVDWKLWSVREKRIVFETNTSGIGHSANRDQNLAPAAAQAMGDAVARLLQTVTAQQYLTFGHLAMPASDTMAIYQQQNGPQPESIAAPIAPAAATLATLPTTSILLVHSNTSAVNDLPLATRVNAAVVSINMGQTNSYGLVIDSNGYILAAGLTDVGADTVFVTFSSGEQKNAEVIRRDNAHDLTLLKVAPGSYSSLPIETARPKAGNSVYVIDKANLVKGRSLDPGKRTEPVILDLPNSPLGVPIVNAEGAVLGLINGHKDRHATMIPITTAYRVIGLAIIFDEN